MRCLVFRFQNSLGLFTGLGASFESRDTGNLLIPVSFGSKFASRLITMVANFETTTLGHLKLSTGLRRWGPGNPEPRPEQISDPSSPLHPLDADQGRGHGLH